MGAGEGYDDDGGLFDPNRSWDDAIEHILDGGEGEKAWLENELDRIDEQLEQRDAVHEEIVGNLEWKIDRYVDRLERLESKWRGDSKELRQVKQRLHTFYKELREEHRDHWRDQQRLGDERRQVLRELDRIDGSYLSEI